MQPDLTKADIVAFVDCATLFTQCFSNKHKMKPLSSQLLNRLLLYPDHRFEWSLHLLTKQERPDNSLTDLSSVGT